MAKLIKMKDGQIEEVCRFATPVLLNIGLFECCNENATFEYGRNNFKIIFTIQLDEYNKNIILNKSYECLKKTKCKEEIKSIKFLLENINQNNLYYQYEKFNIIIK